MTASQWNPKSPLITAPELPLLAALHRVLVLHCGAVWNNKYDTLVDERLQPLPNEFDPAIGVYAMDIDNEVNWPFCQEVGVLNIPALVCLIGGKHQKTLIGVRNENHLKTHFQEWLTAADAAPDDQSV